MCNITHSFELVQLRFWLIGLFVGTRLDVSSWTCLAAYLGQDVAESAEDRLFMQLVLIERQTAKREQIPEYQVSRTLR